ncbi:MAG: ATP-binding protein [Thiolinea sp.]
MISLSIRSKLFLAIFLACAVAVTAAAALFHYRIQKAFTTYIQTLDATVIENSVDVLEQYYARHQSWDRLADHRTWRKVLFSGSRQIRRKLPPEPREARIRLERNPPSGRRIFFRIVLFDKHKNHLQGRKRKKLPALLKPLIQNQETIGYLGMYQRREFNDDSDDARFVNQQKKTLLMVALLTLLISFLIAFLLSRQLVKPIQSLRRSSSELARGNYATRIKVQNNDELGLLSQDFNKLAQSLQQHEQSRQQWIMDIAHELRTPLAILRGEIEAIQDGISLASPDTIQSLHQETLHLQRLVDDLYTLSMSDNGSLSYQKNQLDLTELLRETLAQFEPKIQQSGLQLQQNIPATAVWFNGDSQRLQQLIQNLIKNSLRYTNSPGELHISLCSDTENIVLQIADSAPGVPDTALPHLFERLYRVESSRNRATGGAGIGLSICHNIVQAHDGTIQAGHSPYGGLQISVTLPQEK